MGRGNPGGAHRRGRCLPARRRTRRTPTAVPGSPATAHRGGPGARHRGRTALERAEVERLLGPRAETENPARPAPRRPGLGPAAEAARRCRSRPAPRLTDDEAFDLLGDATDALRAAGVDVHWPRDLVKALTATAETGQ